MNEKCEPGCREYTHWFLKLILVLSYMMWNRLTFPGYFMKFDFGIPVHFKRLVSFGEAIKPDKWG